MQTDELTELQRQRRIAQSPLLNKRREEEEAALEQTRSTVDVPEWSATPEQDVKKAGDGVVPIDTPQPFLPPSDADLLRRDLDLVGQQLADKQRGRKRPLGSWSPEYLKPQTRTVKGRDLATGQVIMSRGDPDNEVASRYADRSIELLRTSNNNIYDGPDGDGLRGLAYLAASVQEEGGTLEDFKRYASQYGAPEYALGMAWTAADSGGLHRDLEQAFTSEVGDDELQEIPQREPEQSFTEDELASHQPWLEAAQRIWEYENGTPYAGDPQTLNDWALNEMSNFNWRVVGDPNVNGTSMAYYGTQAYRHGGEYAQALYDLISIYDATETNLGTVGRSVGALFTDPTTYMGLSGVAKPIVKSVAKNRMVKWLEGIVGQQAAGRIVQNAAVGAVEGGVYTGVEDAIRQSVAINAGEQEEYSAAQGAAATAVGVGAGLFWGTAVGELVSPNAMNMYGATWSQMRNNLQAGPGRLTPMSRQVGAVGDIANLNERIRANPPGGEDRLSTRIPGGAKPAADPMAEYLAVGIDAVPEVVMKKTADQMEEWPMFRATKRKDATPAQRIERMIDQMTNNLLYLHDEMKPEIRARAKQWYDGARKQTVKWSREFGVEPRQVAGIIAALSPQNPWYTNMSQAERVMRTMKEQGRFKPDEKMVAEGDRIYKNDRLKTAWSGVKGKTLDELETDYEKALWIRAYDQSHNPRQMRLWTPEGELGDWVTTAGGSRAVPAWGDTGSIAKAISIYRDGSPANISKRLGNAHKVRNFYNNIVSPMSDKGEVTIDTHAVAAALMSPLGASSKEVGHALGGGPSNLPQGISGSYWMFAEAYRRAAKERGVLPRELQSITWEEVRTIFDKKTARVKKDVESVWKKYKNGKLTLSQSREKINEITGGATDPDWSRPSTGVHGEKVTSTYQESVPGTGVSRGSTGADAGGTGGADPAGAKVVPIDQNTAEPVKEYSFSKMISEEDKLLNLEDMPPTADDTSEVVMYGLVEGNNSTEEDVATYFQERLAELATEYPDDSWATKALTKAAADMASDKMLLRSAKDVAGLGTDSPLYERVWDRIQDIIESHISREQP